MFAIFTQKPKKVKYYYILTVQTNAGFSLQMLKYILEVELPSDQPKDQSSNSVEESVQPSPEITNGNGERIIEECVASLTLESEQIRSDEEMTLDNSYPHDNYCSDEKVRVVNFILWND